MRKLFFFLVAGLLASAVQAQQMLVASQSSIVFTIKQMGVPLDGSFSKFDAQVAFDTRKPEAGKISLSIDLGSAAVGDAETSRELKKPEWFYTGKFPVATFVSNTIKPVGVGKYEVTGILTIKGNAKPVTVPVTLTPGASGATVAQGNFSIKRIDFKIGEGDWTDVSIVANDVLVKFKLALTGL